MVLDAAYHMGAWTGGVCTPSRHMIMSGRTLWHIPNKPGRMNNPHITNPQLVPPDLALHTLPAVFNNAGYDTMRTCKNGNSYEEANKLLQYVMMAPAVEQVMRKAARGTPNRFWIIFRVVKAQNHSSFTLDFLIHMTREMVALSF